MEICFGCREVKELKWHQMCRWRDIVVEVELTLGVISFSEYSLATLQYVKIQNADRIVKLMDSFSSLQALKLWLS